MTQSAVVGRARDGDEEVVAFVELVARRARDARGASRIRVGREPRAVQAPRRGGRAGVASRRGERQGAEGPSRAARAGATRLKPRLLHELHGIDRRTSPVISPPSCTSILP